MQKNNTLLLQKFDFYKILIFKIEIKTKIKHLTIKMNYKNKTFTNKLKKIIKINHMLKNENFYLINILFVFYFYI